MSSFKIEIDGVAGEIKRTLNFMGKDYMEIWTEDGANCACELDSLVDIDFPDMNEEDAYIIRRLGIMDENELLEAMAELTDYEGVRINAKDKR